MTLVTANCYILKKNHLGNIHTFDTLYAYKREMPLKMNNPRIQDLKKISELTSGEFS